MTLYEIDKAITECVDEETGEVLDIDRLEQLQMDREQKIESVALWIKDLKAEAEAIKAEKDAFADRQKRIEKKIESLKNYLTFALGGNKFSTPKCAVSFTTSHAVEVNEEELPKKYMVKKTTFSPDKVLLKKLLSDGAKIKGARLVDNLNAQIK